jgi:hypothetical protein
MSGLHNGPTTSFLVVYELKTFGNGLLHLHMSESMVK